MRKYGVEYKTDSGNGYNGKELYTLVIVSAIDVGSAITKSILIMEHEAMNLDDLWFENKVAVIEEFNEEEDYKKYLNVFEGSLYKK